MIDVVDDFLTPEELDFVVEYCVDAPYYYGEADNSDTPVTGLVHNVWFDGMSEDDLTSERTPKHSVDDSTIDTKKFYTLFADKIAEKFSDCDKKNIAEAQADLEKRISKKKNDKTAESAPTEPDNKLNEADKSASLLKQNEGSCLPDGPNVTKSDVFEPEESKPSVFAELFSDTDEDEESRYSKNVVCCNLIMLTCN